MFSELPKLFDRDFATAYFLPITLFMLASAWTLNAAGYLPGFRDAITGRDFFDITVLILAAWIASTILLVLNREIYRVLEGYGRYNPLRLFENRARQKFNTLRERLAWLDEEYDILTPDLRDERTRLMKKLAEMYPDQERFVLPTAFGNAIRAFEVYPRVMYGLEGIDGWSRILASIPKDYRELIDGAKSQVDWWVNLAVMSLIFLVEFWSVVFYRWGLKPGWFTVALNILIPLAVFVLLNWLFFWRATQAAVGWGDFVKSAFDIYRFALLDLLSIEIPRMRADEKKLWTNLSYAFLFHLPGKLPELKATRRPKAKKEHPNT